MEGTHTVLCLHKPIQEFSHISLYFPTGRVRSFTYGIRAPRDCQPLYANQRNQKDEDPARAKQRGQSYTPAGDASQSCNATKGVLAELQWLSAEHWQLLVDLLPLCGDCASRVTMGNQDGKFQGPPEAYAGHLLHSLSSSNLQHALSLSPEHKRVASRVRKLKKLGIKKNYSAEEFMQSKMKKEVGCITASEIPQTYLDADGTPSFHASTTPGPGSYVSNEPLLPMEGPFHTAQEGWDFMEDPRLFDSETDLCTELTEFEEQFCLSYGASSCTFMDNVGNNIRPSIFSSSIGNETFEEQSGDRTTAQLYDDINRRDIVVTKEQTIVDSACHSSVLGTTEGSSDAVDVVPHTSKDRSVMGHDYQRFKQEKVSASNENCTQSHETRSNTENRSSEAMRLSLSPLTQVQSRTWIKTPTSPSLSGVFNVSYPTTNSLPSMSPALSPLSSMISSPQLNHRILLLPEEDGIKDKDGEKKSHETTGYWSEAENQLKVTTGVIDKNGNCRTITRLDLNLSQQGAGNSTFSTAGASGFTSTGECKVRFIYVVTQKRTEF